ncbi:MAG: hypothetical protein KGZ74_04585 [Chitinophagaceae bacterium]|uniref:hypothetical protein n=1 Tax=Sediminibacterium sp. TaxID=1917865 RepID=UPI001BBDA15C|nr:hypothetical protein [Chitinophagaceae bacterium]
MEEIIISKSSRCYSEIDSLIIVMAALSLSMEYKHSGKANYNPGDYLVAEGLSTGKMVRLPLYGPIEAVLINRKPDQITLTVEKKSPPTVRYETYTDALKQTINYIITPYFVTFYENNLNYAINKFGSDYSKWSGVWRMGWVVRNALSHNGKIFFKNLKTPDIDWNGIIVTTSFQHKPIHEIFSFADILLLMLEMEAELN